MCTLDWHATLLMHSIMGLVPGTGGALAAATGGELLLRVNVNYWQCAAVQSQSTLRVLNSWWLLLLMTPSQDNTAEADLRDVKVIAVHKVLLDLKSNLHSLQQSLP